MDILFWLALAPALILLWIVYRKDQVEQEPPRLILRLFLYGVLSAFVAMVLEMIGSAIMDSFSWSSLTAYNFVMFFFVVALSEEIAKFLFLNTTRKNPHFNYTFDGIVYAVAVGLGFAAIENIMYVFSTMSFGVAIMRGILSVPLHCTCAIFMGCYFGLAHKYRRHGLSGKAAATTALALIIPICIHGFYDFSMSSESEFVTMLGFIFTVIIFILAVVQVRSSSKYDEPVDPYPTTPQAF